MHIHRDTEEIRGWLKERTRKKTWIFHIPVQWKDYSDDFKDAGFSYASTECNLIRRKTFYPGFSQANQNKYPVTLNRNSNQMISEEQRFSLPCEIRHGGLDENEVEEKYWFRCLANAQG